MASLYDFTDYRRFLKEQFAELKRTNPHFSYRFFNRQAGIRSSGFLKLVIDGKRNLEVEGIAKVARGLKLDPQERRYFEALVRFNQAKTPEEKDYYLRETSEYQTTVRTRRLADAQSHLFSRWYYVAILELLRLDDHAPKDLSWLQKRIKPTVGIADLQKAVSELKLLNLLTEEEGGVLRTTETMLATSDEVSSAHIAHFHIQMSQRAIESIRQDPAERREFSGLTVATSEEGFQHLKKALQEFRRRLHTIAEREGAKTVVTQVNLQLFPLNR